MKKIIYILTSTALLFTACKKADLAGNDATGEGLVGFTLKSPVSSTNLKLNSAVPNNTIDFTWGAAKPGLTTAPTYKVIMALKTTGSLDAPLISFTANNSGKDTKLTVTYKQLDDALAAKSIAAGASTDLVWSVQADNGDVKILATNSFFITITRFQNGTAPFVLLGPSSSLTPLAMDPGSTTNTVKFNWTKSIPATGSPAVKYSVYFAQRKLDAQGAEITPDFTNPLFSIASDNTGNDSLLTITYKAISDSLNAHGLTNLSVAAELKWTVAATSGTWVQWCDYVNTFVALREVRMYMPGSYTTPSWDPPTAPELVRDLRAGGGINAVYFTYVYLIAGTSFKVTQGRAWDVNYGPATTTTGTGGALQLNSSNNFNITTTGVYRFSVDRVNMTYDLRLGRMGFVGGAVPGNNWTPATTFTDPLSQMTNFARDRFIGIVNLNAGGWKMIDNNSWNGGGVNITDTRSYGATTDGSGNGTSLLINGPDNLPDVATAGRYRVIWDGADVNNIKYLYNSASQMRVVGDGINQAGVNDWDPASSPQMTYAGNGKWTITLTLKAGKDIKFLAGSAWGAFDYEDNSGQSNATGTPRKMVWDGNNNFKTPAAAGTYTITLDELAQTVTIQ